MANGVRDDLPVEDAVACAAMLLATGRAVHPAKWVDDMVAEAEVAALGGFVSWRKT